MIPEHVLRKMRAAIIAVGAAGCTRSSSGGAAAVGDVDASTNDAAVTSIPTDGDAAVSDPSVDDGGIADAAVDGAVIACPYHPEGHAKLADGGVVQARPDPGITLGSLKMEPGHYQCPGCGMGGPIPGHLAPNEDQVTISPATGVAEPRASAVNRALAAQRAGIRTCYRAALAANPNVVGTVTAAIAWDENGAVKTVAMQGGDGLDAAMLACVARRVKLMSASPSLANATATARIKFSLLE